GDAGGDLGAAELLGDEDRRLLPARRGRDHDRVDPIGGLEALEALGQERPATQLRECLRAIPSEPFPAAGGSEDGPDAQAGLRWGRDLGRLLLRAAVGEDAVEPLRRLVL